MNKKEFLFLPDDKVRLIVGMPGPDTAQAFVISDDGGERVRLRVPGDDWGIEPYETDALRREILWDRTGPVGKRFREQGGHTAFSENG